MEQRKIWLKFPLIHQSSLAFPLSFLILNPLPHVLSIVTYFPFFLSYYFYIPLFSLVPLHFLTHDPFLPSPAFPFPSLPSSLFLSSILFSLSFLSLFSFSTVAGRWRGSEEVTEAFSSLSSTIVSHSPLLLPPSSLPENVSSPPSLSSSTLSPAIVSEMLNIMSSCFEEQYFPCCLKAISSILKDGVLYLRKRRAKESGIGILDFFFCFLFKFLNFFFFG